MRNVNSLLLSQNSDLMAAIASRDKAAAIASRIETAKFRERLSACRTLKKQQKVVVAQQAAELLLRDQVAQLQAQNAQMQESLRTVQRTANYYFRARLEVEAAREHDAQQAKQLLAIKNANIEHLKAVIKGRQILVEPEQAALDYLPSGEGNDAMEITDLAPETQQQTLPTPPSTPEATMADCYEPLTQPAFMAQAFYDTPDTDLPDAPEDSPDDHGDSMMDDTRSRANPASRRPTDRPMNSGTVHAPRQDFVMATPLSSTQPKLDSNASPAHAEIRDALTPSSMADTTNTTSSSFMSGPELSPNSMLHKQDAMKEKAKGFSTTSMQGRSIGSRRNSLSHSTPSSMRSKGNKNSTTLGPSPLRQVMLSTSTSSDNAPLRSTGSAPKNRPVATSGRPSNVRAPTATRPLSHQTMLASAHLLTPVKNTSPLAPPSLSSPQIATTKSLVQPGGASRIGQITISTSPSQRGPPNSSSINSSNHQDEDKNTRAPHVGSSSVRPTQSVQYNPANPLKLSATSVPQSGSGSLNDQMVPLTNRDLDGTGVVNFGGQKTRVKGGSNVLKDERSAEPKSREKRRSKDKSARDYDPASAPSSNQSKLEQDRPRGRQMERRS